MKEIKEKNNNGSVVVVVNNSSVAICEGLKDYFNNNTTFDKVERLSNVQKRMLGIAVARYGEDRVKECFRKAENSDFLSGRKGCDWSADFDWIIKCEHIERILSGKYDDFKYNNKPAQQNTLSSFEGDEFIEAALARGFDE